VSGERNCTTIAVERWVKALTVITISVELMSDNAIRFTYRIIYKTYLIIITIMNNTIQIFENKEFGAIRTMSDQQGQTWFCGRDVAEALGYKKPENALAQHVEKGDTLKQGTPTTSGIQLMLFINESGLYSLILSSKLDPVSPFSAKSQRTKTESQPFQYGKTL
jgi:hypothetical protein